jgi:glycosyltransferase involved in cell wall biosynthesis
MSLVSGSTPVPRAPHAAPELAGLRILLVHEWLYTWAGAERCLEQLVALMPHADVFAGIVTADMRRQHAIAAQAQESWVGRIPGARQHHRWFLPAHALAFRTHDTSSYDLIVSVSHAFEKAIRTHKPGAVHVSYCLSPPRYLWDLADAHDALATPLQRLALRTARGPLRMLDRSAARGVHHFVSLSQHVAARVRRAYGRESAVVYPPVAIKPMRATSGRRQSFLLSLSRLVPYKRVDLAITAAERLGMRLIVAGDGPARGRLMKLAGPHTEFVGSVSEEEAGELLSTCAALVFCAEEDFGIVPLEANAHGTPVVAFDAGGARETMRNGETAILFSQQTVQAVTSAIEQCLARSWDVSALQANAARFTPSGFRDGMRAVLRDAVTRALS